MVCGNGTLALNPSIIGIIILIVRRLEMTFTQKEVSNAISIERFHSGHGQFKKKLEVVSM